MMQQRIIVSVQNEDDDALTIPDWLRPAEYMTTEGFNW